MHAINTSTHESIFFATPEEFLAHVHTHGWVTHGRIFNRRGYSGPAFSNAITGEVDLTVDPAIGDRWELLDAEVVYVTFDIPNSLLRIAANDPELEFGLKSHYYPPNKFDDVNDSDDDIPPTARTPDDASESDGNVQINRTPSDCSD